MYAINKSAMVSLLGLGLVFHLSATAYSQSPTVIPQDDFGGLLEGLDLGAKPPMEKPPAGDVAELESGPAAPLIKAFESMQTARQLFAADKPVLTIVQAQQRAIDLLDQLIEAATQDQEQDQESAPSEPKPQSPEEAKPQPRGPESSESEEPSSEESEQPSGSDSDSGEPSSDQGGEQGAMPDNATAASPRSIDANGQAIWGHLPQRTRGMLRAEIPTEYLPKYSQQISDYFRALAEMPGSDR